MINCYVCNKEIKGYGVTGALGRYLKPSEDVHHINNNRTDNSPYNLMGFVSRSAHRRYECGSEVSPDEIIFDGRKLK